MKSPLRYFGGKSALAPLIGSLIPQSIKIYCEPFCGAANVFFSTRGRWAKLEVLNDINENLINFYRVMQNVSKRQRLIELLEFTPMGRQVWNTAKKSLKVIPSNDVERAWHWFIFNQQSFNSGRKSWGVPGRSGRDNAEKWRESCERLGVLDLVQRLKQAVIECQPFEIVMDRLDSPKTLFYIDPPYQGVSDPASMSAAYEGHVMTESDNAKLIELCLTSKSGIILSGYEMDGIPDSWQKIVIDVAVHSDPRRHKRRASEIIWVNPQAQIARLF